MFLRGESPQNDMIRCTLGLVILNLIIKRWSINLPQVWNLTTNMVWNLRGYSEVNVGLCPVASPLQFYNECHV